MFTVLLIAAQLTIALLLYALITDAIFNSKDSDARFPTVLLWIFLLFINILGVITGILKLFGGIAN